MDVRSGAVSADTIIGELATHYPNAIPVLERLGLDYCCGGQRRLGNAVAEAGLEWPSVAAQLDEALALDEAKDSPSWAEASLVELMVHILERYHAKLREDLPMLSGMGEKVVSAHGGRHPELRDVLSVFADLRAELDSHLMKEEQILFPFIEQLEAGLGSRHPMLGHIASPIAVMTREHDSAGAALGKLRAITSTYAVPDDGCSTFRGYYWGLATLERELHEHIHLENNVLYPRAQELEARVLAQR